MIKEEGAEVTGAETVAYNWLLSDWA